MKIIGCDFHPSYQQIAMLDPGTGEMGEKALSHERKEEVRAFYAGLEGSARVGIEASGQSQWFERMLAELGHEVWIGDAAKIRASCERKQKTDPLPLLPWASRRRPELLQLLDQLDGSIGELDRAVGEQASARPAASIDIIPFLRRYRVPVGARRLLLRRTRA